MADNKEEKKVPKMKTKRMGNTGLKVSEICLGAMGFGWWTDEETSFKILDRFAELGGNFIDTANMYGRPKYGASETVVGKWLSTKRREDFVIATKFRFPVGTGANDSGANMKHIFAAVEDSLKRLQTSYIDLYQIHGFDKETPVEETLVALNDLVRSGKVRYIGVSNFRGYQLMKAHYLAKELHVEKFTCLQPHYNLLARETEWEILEVTRDLGMGVIPWSPLKSGWLTGKYTKDMTAPPPNSRVDNMKFMPEVSWQHQANEHTWTVLEVLKEVSTKLGKTMSQVAIRWLMQKGTVTAPIIGPRNLEQAEDNFQVFDWSIPAEEMKTLDAVSVPSKVPHPYSWESTSAY